MHWGTWKNLVLLVPIHIQFWAMSSCPLNFVLTLWIKLCHFRRIFMGVHKLSCAFTWKPSSVCLQRNSHKNATMWMNNQAIRNENWMLVCSRWSSLSWWFWHTWVPFAEGPLSPSPADAAQQCTGWDRHSATIFTQLWFLISSYSGATDWENLETGHFLGRKCK